MQVSKQVSSIYNKIAKSYADEFSSPSEHLDEFLNLLPKGAKIIDIGNSRLQKAVITSGNQKERESQVAWLHGNDIEFAFRRVTDAVLHINDQFFNFDLFWSIPNIRKSPRDPFNIYIS